MALGKVYCFGPTFRAEKSKTRRHLTEFWMVEPEMAYADLNDVIELAEELIVSIVSRVLDKRGVDLRVLERDTSKLESIRTPFPRLTYDEAAQLLKEKGQSFEYGTDLGGTDETVLSEQFDRPVCITHYPESVKARVASRFGHLNNNQAAELVAGVKHAGLQWVAGLHLSERNNSPQQARESLAPALASSPCEFHLAVQDDSTGWIEIV